MNNSAIILAAGKGTRYKEKKQDILFHGKPIWHYAFETVLDIIPRTNVVVVGKDVAGGDTRTGSVLNGLKALPDNTDRVVIVEAARPMVTCSQIQELINDVHPSTSFVRPLVNTVIYKNGDYINRSELYDLLTPQAFDYKLLLEAYESGKFNDMTDETRAMYEFHGIKPHFIETDSNLYKITYPGDLDIIESIYKRQCEEGLRK